MSAQQQPVTPPSPVQIFNTVQGYQRAFALKAAVDLDLFTAIAKGSHTTAEIAKACNAAERGVRILSDSLVVMGFLTKAGNRYSLTADTAFFLDSRSPAYLGLAFKFLMHPTQLAHFEHLGAAVRNGGSSDEDSTLAPNDPIWIEFAKGMAPMMMPAAQAMAGIAGCGTEFPPVGQDSGYCSQPWLVRHHSGPAAAQSPHLCPGLGQRA